MLMDEQGFTPKHRWDGQYDPSIPELNLTTANRHDQVFNYVLSNSFAFGGNNIALILERAS
jgi:3-oxoacyl-[acyl-carrier-protein] synthase-1